MVAQAAGVSRATVSRVANHNPLVDPETRRKVIAAAEKLGYLLESRQRPRTVGIIMPAPLPSEEPLHQPLGSYQSMMLYAILEELNARNFRSVIITENGMELVRDRVICGALAISGDSLRNQDWAETTNLPLIRFSDRGAPGENIFTVYFDNRTNLRLAVDHLRANGHRRIGLLLPRSAAAESGRLDQADRTFMAMAPGNEALISYADGSSLADRLDLLLAREITALITYPGDLALQVCRELNRRGLKVPDDISLVTREFDGVTAYWNPPLTCFEPNLRELARAALDLLERILDHRPPLENIGIPGRLILRQSVKKVHFCS